MAFLAEILLGLFLLGALVVTGLQTYLSAQEQRNITELSSNIVLLRANIEKLYTSSYDGLENDVMTQANLVPPSLVKGGQIVTPWGDLTIGSEDGSNYTIELTGMSPKGCQALATQGADAWAKIEVNSNTAWDRSETDPVDPADIVGFCDNKANTVTFTGP